jgi:hypothetical protein
MNETDIKRMGYMSPHGIASEKSSSRVPKDCPFYYNCSASLCPLDPEMDEKVWLPEESDTHGMCRNREFTGMQLIKTQKKIVKALKKRMEEHDDYFSYGMLDRNMTVKSGIRGIRSDSPDNVKDSKAWYVNREKAWNAKHPERKKLSEENIKKLICHLRKKEA